MGGYTSVGWSTLVLCSIMCQTLTQTNYGEYSGDPSINSNHINVVCDGSKQPDGKCRYSVLGRGVDDNFAQDCANNVMDYSQINIANYYAFFYPDRRPFTLYTDTWGTLVLLKDTGCTLRTYQSPTPKEVTLSGEICGKIKRKIEDEMAKVTEYWGKWSINHELKMNKQPPAEVIVDPLKNQPPTPSLYAGQPGVPVSIPSTTSNYAQNGGVKFGENGSMNFGSPSEDDDSEDNDEGTSGENESMKSGSSTEDDDSDADEDETPTQPLKPSLPAQHISSPTTMTHTGGRTILGESSIESNDESSINRNKFNVYGDVETNRDGTMTKCIEGRIVHDCFTIPREYKKPGSIAMSGYVVIGHPSTHPFSVFSDEPATLYLFENGMCTKKTYTTQGGVTTSKVQFMSNNECGAAKEKMQKSLKRNNIIIGPDGSISASM